MPLVFLIEEILGSYIAENNYRITDERVVNL